MRILLLVVVLVAGAARAEDAAPASLAPQSEAALSHAEPLAGDDAVHGLPPPATSLGELGSALAKMGLMLGVVVALAYLSLNKGLGKLLERQNAGKRMKVVERVALDAKRSLFLLEIEGRRMVIAAGDGGVVHLKDLDQGQDNAEGARARPKPAEFSGLVGGGRGAEAPLGMGLVPTPLGARARDEEA